MTLKLKLEMLEGMSSIYPVKHINNCMFISKTYQPLYVHRELSKWCQHHTCYLTTNSMVGNKDQIEKLTNHS